MRTVQQEVARGLVAAYKAPWSVLAFLREVNNAIQRCEVDPWPNMSPDVCYHWNAFFEDVCFEFEMWNLGDVLDEDWARE